MKRIITVGKISFELKDLQMVSYDTTNKMITIYHTGHHPFFHKCESKHEADVTYAEICRKLRRAEKWEKIVRFFTGKKMYETDDNTERTL